MEIRYDGGFELICRKLRTNLSVDKESQPQDASPLDREDDIPFFVVLIDRDLLAGYQSQQVIRAYLTNPLGGKLSECLNKSGGGLDEMSHLAKCLHSHP